MQINANIGIATQFRQINMAKLTVQLALPLRPITVVARQQGLQQFPLQ